MIIAKSIAAGMAAFVAGAGTMLLGAQIFPIATWYGQAAASALASTVWMLAGLYVAPRSRLVASGLLVSGSVLMGWWSRGVVHSVSPYYGLAPFAASIVAAAGAWLWFETKHAGHPGDPAVLGLVVLTVFVGHALWGEVPGLDRTLRLGGGEELRVGVAVDSEGSRFIWTPSSVTEIPPESSVELDPGSGFVSPSVFQRVSGEAERRRVCAVFGEQDRDDLAEEIRERATPGLFGAFPASVRPCLSGEVWEFLGPRGVASSG